MPPSSETAAETRLTPPAQLDRRRHIAEAARGIFASHGLAGAKTRQIAEAAGVTETILYRHFDSKEEIFEEAILVPVEELAADLLRLTSEFSKISPRRRFQLSEEFHLEILHVLREITPLLGVALFSDREAGRRFYAERLVPVWEKAIEATRQAMPAKQRRRIEPQELFFAMLGIHLGLSINAHFGELELDEDAAAHLVTKMIAFGLGKE